VVHGEAGVGKSLLLRMAIALASGFMVLRVTGVEAEAELPFSTLTDLLTPFVAGIAALAGPRGVALRGALRLSDDPVTDRFAAYDGARAVLHAAASEQPVLVVVDDAHWIDAASREALLFCARRANESAIAFLFAVRDGSGAQLDDSELRRLHLAGLAEGPSMELAQRVRPDITRGVARELHRGTGGNPLAIEELASELTAGQARGREPVPAPLPVGPSLRGFFEGRMGDLEVDTRAALVVAAASETGRMDRVGAAIELLDIPAGALAPAESAGLITLAGGLLEWRHPLVRSAAYHGATGEQRRAAHLALARSARADSLDDHRAWHLAAAAAAPDEQVASELEQLAERARERGAIAAVARALETAARLSPADDERGRRLIAASAAVVATGDTTRTLDLLAEAERRTADPRLRAEIERLRARAEIIVGVPQSAHDRLVREAAKWRDNDPALAAELLTEALVAHMAQGGREQYIESAERALAAGRRAGGALEALPGVVLGMGRIANGEPDLGIELLEAYGGVVESPEFRAAAPEIVGMYGLTHVWLENFETAERLLTGMTEEAREQGAVRSLAFPLAVLGELNHRLGRWPTAVAMVEESVRLAEDVGEGALLANNVCYLARMRALLGDRDRAAETAERGLALCRSQNLRAIAPHAHYALGVLAFTASEYSEAARHFEAADDIEVFGREPGLTIWLPELVEARVRARDVDAARAPLEEFAKDVARTRRVRGLAQLARLRGMLAPADDFDEFFGEALDWHAKLPAPFEEARTRLAYGELLRRQQRRADARVQLASALRTFEELGARDFAQRASTELRAAGARKPTSADDPWRELTEAERRVAEVIVSGATYGEAAQTLFLSPRTVEHHLRHAYRKLGVRSRAELARLLS
jgi:DNA-binding CsgD family transcriptional regulator